MMQCIPHYNTICANCQIYPTAYCYPHVLVLASLIVTKAIPSQQLVALVTNLRSSLPLVSLNASALQRRYWWPVVWLVSETWVFHFRWTPQLKNDHSLELILYTLSSVVTPSTSTKPGKEVWAVVMQSKSTEPVNEVWAVARKV